MSKTCIVCLDSLEDEPPPPLSETADPTVKPEVLQDGVKQELDTKSALKLPSTETRLIAKLLPCCHTLHDACLTPWKERCSSCPICRQNFHMVELYESIDGPVVDTYAVNEKKQEAELDPTLYMDEIEYTDTRPCPMCNMADNEEDMILCDGCDRGVHSYCLDLDHYEGNVDGAWYCAECRADGYASRPSGTLSRIHGIRNREQRRASRFRSQVTSSAEWARLWRSVWNQLDLDLDFPYEDDAASARYRRAHNAARNQGRRFRAWERRLEVAQEQGAGETFEDTADILTSRDSYAPGPREQPDAPEVESSEELMAWNALEKARDIEEGQPTRKRKPTPSSPADDSRRKRRRTASESPRHDLPAPQPERKFKRPQTRRNAGSNSTAETSTIRAADQTDASTGHDAPSFLQSLLNEVEAATPEETNGTRLTLNLTNLPSHSVSDHPSPQQSLPGSPTISNHPTPRPMSATPPPNGALPGSPGPPPRPGSPILLTSNIVPIYPPAPDLTKETSSAARSRRARTQTRVSRWAANTARSSSPPGVRSEDASPTRQTMSLEAKGKLQRLVKNALRTPYQTNQISKEQYADINRAVSHLLYDKVGYEGELNESNEEILTNTAKEEVSKALQALRESS